MVIKKNLNITDLLLPLPPILSVANKKVCIRKKEKPSFTIKRCRYIHSSEKKNPHSLQVKGLYHRTGTDPLKRLKIKDQLQKWLRRTVVTAEGGSPFWEVWEHPPPEKF